MALAWLAIPLAVALVVSALATPLVSRLALACGAVDRPNERKVSPRPDMPLLGGFSVALGFFVGLSTAILLAPAEARISPHLEALLLGGLLMLGIGAFDDRFGLSALPKLGIQVLAAGIAIALGFQLDHLTDPVTRQVWHFPIWLVWIVTTLWIVIVTNAINLIDGLDGLATGVAAIIGATLVVIAWQAGNVAGMLIGAALVGSLLGFLPYNFPPARIFAGDTGSLFMGYSLALLSLEGYQKVTVLTFLVPLLVLAVPLLDVSLSILRRLRRGGHIMKPDRLHIHHRLLDAEGSHRSAVLALYFLTACFCIIAVSFTRLHGLASLLFLLAVLVLTFRLVRNLGLFEVELTDGPKGDAGPPAGEESH